MPETKTKPKPAEPVSPAVAAQQAYWHCRQAASYFADSQRSSFTARGREVARKKFIVNTRAALPTLGLETFLEQFKAWLKELGESGYEAEGVSVIRELAAEIEVKPASDVALAQRLLETALKLMNGGKS